MLRTIELHGVLADKFGKCFELDVSSPKEACQALSHQIVGFKQFMTNAHKDGLFFAVYNDDSNIGANEIGMQTGAQVIRIVPEIVGAGGDGFNWLQVVAGAVLVGVGVVTGNPYLVSAGVGLLVGGVAGLLMPTPSISTQDEAGNKASYGFGSAITTTAAGNPVPVLYGEYEVGGFVISAMVINEDTQ